MANKRQQVKGTRETYSSSQACRFAYKNIAFCGFIPVIIFPFRAKRSVCLSQQARFESAHDKGISLCDREKPAFRQ